MVDALTQLGVGGIFALLIIKEFVSFTKIRRNGKTKFIDEDLCNEKYKNLEKNFIDIKASQNNMHEKVNSICTSVASIKSDISHIKKNGK